MGAIAGAEIQVVGVDIDMAAAAWRVITAIAHGNVFRVRKSV